MGAGGFLPTAGDGLLYTKALVPTRLVRVRIGGGPMGAVAGEPAAQLLGPDGKLFEEASELARALACGEVGEAVTDLMHLQEWARQKLTSGAEKVVLPGAHGFAFAFAPQEEELHASFLQFLTELERQGELSQLIRRCLG